MTTRRPLASALATLFLFLGAAAAAADDLQQVQKAIHDKGLHWTAGPSLFTAEEFRARLGGPHNHAAASPSSAPVRLTLPATFDWRDQGVVTAVRNQGNCGSCWAFSAVGAFESEAVRTGGYPVSIELSEQELVSCGGGGSCDGGNPVVAFNYLQSNGTVDAACFPYAGVNEACNLCADWQSHLYKAGANGAVNGDVDSLKQGVYQYGLLSVCLDITTDFSFYQSGVYSYAWGDFAGTHCVLLVGWDDNNQAFTVKNSWATGFGEDGYFRIAYSEVGGKTQFASGGGFWVAFGSGPTAVACTNCTTGCCDKYGCETGTDNWACGTGGVSCVDCQASGRVCDSQSCVACDANSCPSGCCDTYGCETGADNWACGTGGITCVDCMVSGKTCNSQSCVACDSSSCPNGCCDGHGCEYCGFESCGLGGVQCVACGLGQTCDYTQGICVACNANSCATGCCDEYGCELGAENWVCGWGGAACVACAAGQECVGNTCVCDANMCPGGCCDATGACQPGTANAACGAGGVACVSCSADNECANQVCVANCAAGACTTGCCDGTSCAAGTATAECGANGAACVACVAGQECASVSGGGACRCDAASCPSGCCDASGLCQTGTTNADCGEGGGACAACAWAQECVGGACVCDATTCPYGCCDAASACQPGWADSACGFDGAACVSCAAGQECWAMACRCNADSCPAGCCGNNQCLPGNADDNCGSDGGDCVACPADDHCQGGQCVSGDDDDDNDITDDDNDTTDDDDNDNDDNDITDDDNDTITDDDSTPAMPARQGKLPGGGCGC